MLYVVATPIGNLEDITPRALNALKQVKTVYCEDTRRTRALMSHFGISAPLKRYHEHDERSADAILAELGTGAPLALVSDSGAPGISDPGRKVVALARRAGYPVTSLPGASAVTTALAGSGLPADSFVFLGFLPRSPGKQKKALTAASALGKTIVLYESPFRVVETLRRAQEVLGPDAPICIAREISKIHEEWICASLTQALAALEGREKILGEFVVMLDPSHGIIDQAQ